MKNKRLVFIVLNLLFVHFAHTQSESTLNNYGYPDYIQFDDTVCEKYSFVNFEKNNFTFYTKKSPNFTYLYHQIDSMIRFKDRKLNFYHIGGSHIQADIYSNDFRMFLQTNYKDLPGERGGVFPFNLAGTNNPGNYRFYSQTDFNGYRVVGNDNRSIDFGVLGAVVASSDSVVQLAFKHRRTTSKPRFNHIRIFHNKGEFPYWLNFGKNEILVTCIENNSEVGYTDIQFSDNLDSIDIQFSKTNSVDYQLKIYGFQFMNDLPGFSYNSIGINGAGLYSYLDCERFEEQLKTYPPDFFAFSVGTNDGNVPYSRFDPENYKQNLEKMMQIALRANPDCALLLTVPNDCYYRRRYANKNIAREREVIIELAKEYQMAVWDFYGIMGGLNSSMTWLRSDLMRRDLIHFTREGYHFKGKLLIDAFLKYLIQMEEQGLKQETTIDLSSIIHPHSIKSQSSIQN